MLGPLKRGQIDAAVMPEPYVTQALGRGSHRVAMPFDATCQSQCLITGWMARKDVDPGLAARFRNAIQAASVWADLKKNQAASGNILAEPGVARHQARGPDRAHQLRGAAPAGAGTAVGRRLRRVRGVPADVPGDWIS